MPTEVIGRSYGPYWEVEWQTAPRQPWNRVRWGDLGIQHNPGMTFDVSDEQQARQAIVKLKERHPTARARLLAPGSRWWEERCQQCGSLHEVAVQLLDSRSAGDGYLLLCAQCRGETTDA